MPIIYIPENKNYNPLNLEPYISFNKKFEDKADDLEDALIKIGISSHRKGFVDGFTVDRFYCDDIFLKFIFSRAGATSGDNNILIHHTIEYDFDSSFVEFQQDMAEEVKARAEYLYIPGIKQFDFAYHLSTKSIQLIFDVMAEENKVQEICNQLISHDIAIFSRGW